MFLQEFMHGASYEKLETKLLTGSDSFILNSLFMCGVGTPTAFSLVWGDTLATSTVFPLKIRGIVTGILQEVEKREECDDPCEKQLHSIIIDLLWLVYEREVNIIIDKVLELKQ